MSAVGARIWPWVPVGLLGTLLAGLGTLAVIATGDPSFALEQNYYQKAVHYDDEIRQRDENARLGWKLETELVPAPKDGTVTLVVRARDALGSVAGARVKAEAFHNARASQVIDAELVETVPGEYRASVATKRPGLWEIRLVLERGQERFTEVVRRDLPEVRR